MNNTSAYANVLLKLPVAAPAATASKRDYQNDDSPADFHRTLNDVNESAKRQNDKMSQPIESKKAIQSERSKNLKDDQPIKNAKADKKAADETAAQKTSTDGSSAAKQSYDKEGARVEESSIVRESTKTKEAKTVSVTSQNDLGPDSIGMGMDVRLPMQDAALIEMSLAAGAPDASIETDELQSVSPLGVTTQSEGLTEVVEAPQTLNGATTVTPIIPVAAEETISSADDTGLSSAGKTDVKSVVPNTALGVDDVLQEQQSSQLLTDSLPTDQPNPTAQAVSVASSLASVNLYQPNASASASASASEEVGTLTPLTPNKSALLGTTSAATTADVELSDVAPAQMQMQASKSAFEKALQSIILPESSDADDGVAQPVISSSSNGPHQLMDSLMRATDMQTPAARSFVVQTAVQVPVGQPQWSQAVGEKVLWLAAQNVSSAEINLHPKDLGPLQVKVSVNQEQTTVAFTSQHAVVREVLDQNLNRLRDMFSEQGLNLVNVDVSDKSFSRQQGDPQDQKNQGESGNSLQEEEVPIAMSVIVHQRLVDHYA